MYNIITMFIKLFAIAFSVFLAIDMVWLNVLAKDLYQKQIGFLLADKPNLLAALVFYLLFILALVFFVILPAHKSSVSPLLPALLFGLVTYATYDLTNLATVKDWPLLVTIIDLIWGMSISTAVSFLTLFLANSLGI